MEEEIESAHPFRDVDPPSTLQPCWRMLPVLATTAQLNLLVCQLFG